MDGDRRSPQIHAIGNQRSERIAVHVIDLILIRGIQGRAELLGYPINVIRRPDVQSDCSRVGLRFISGILQRMPGTLMEQANLRVHPPGFGNGIPEEISIKAVAVL
ncbi:hypothetical protein D3C73_978480 [compost metagenome]